MLLRKIIAIATLLVSSVFASPVLQDPSLAPLYTHPDNVIIPESYVVVFKPTVSADDAIKHHMWLTSFVSTGNVKDSKYGINRVFDFGEKVNFRGYTGSFTDEQLAEIRANAAVASVERDGIVYVSESQNNAPWGLARLTTRQELPEDRSYYFEANAGEGVTAYIVDTGVNIHHVDFEGRAVWGATMPKNDKDEDGNGHGTHVAGTVAGKKYGVAKKAKIVAIKVLGSNGSGTIGDVIGGIEWAANDHLRREKKGGKVKSVANMSLGGGYYKLLNDAVDAAVEAGIHFAVAAGNDNRDACGYSPASAVKAITVGATNKNDERAYFSNWGRCTDIFAPGQEIESAWIGSSTATNTISGTSMASPHVCGAVAALLSREIWEDMTPRELKAELIRIAGRNYIHNMPPRTRTPNKLLFIPAIKKPEPGYDNVVGIW
ncbi:serine protease [Nowakowskiella sp. JEL0407]|nr:serine protease [Nowakowskiella sp. JEL0407]